MKKILSVFLSLILVLSMCFNVVVTEASSASVTVINRSTNLIDITGVEDYVLVTVKDAAKRRHIKWNNVENTSVTLYLNSNTQTVYADSETFPGNTVIKIPQDDLTYMQFTTSASRADFQKVSLSGKVYYTASGTPRWNIRGTPNMDCIMADALEANKWYRFDISLDMTQTSSNMTVTYTEILSSESSAEGAVAHTISKTFTSGEKVNNFRHYIGAPTDATVYYDDIKTIRHEAQLIKSTINKVGSDGVVADGQNKVSITFSTEIPDLTKDYVKINESGKEDNLVSSIEITSDGTNPVVIASLSENLKDWSEYEITIDPLCYGAGATQVTNGGAPEAVTSINGSFITPSPSFGMKNPVFSVNAENLNAKALVVNTSGTPQDTTFIFSAFDSEGRISAITSVTEADFNNSLGEYLEADVLVNAGESFDFFVVNGWSSKKPLFGKTYAVNSSGEEIAKSAFSSGEPMADSGAAIKLGEFDYENIKINVSLDTKTSAVTDGILYVYKNGESLSDINLPVYAKPVSTASTGRLTLDILLPQSLTYGQYKAEYVSEDISTSETFNYYSPTELEAIKKQAIADSVKACTSSGELKQIILGCDSAGNMINNNFKYIAEGTDLTDYSSLNNKESFYLNMLSMVGGVTDFNSLCTLIESCASSQKASEIAAHKAQIVADAKASINAAGLMKVILGIDDSEKVVNNNFELISQNTDLSVYNTLKNKAAVFSHMISTVKNTTDFADLVYRFEQAAITQKSRENTPARPSSNNSSFGGSSTPIKETTSAPQTGSSQPGTSVLAPKFNDMSGHWASNYVDALYDRGIMNGYEDGSFRGENSISRAELAKTLVEAFAVLASEGNTFSDVSDDSWYSSYVAAASASGIVNGFEDGTFAPNRAVTRQDAVLMLYRAMSLGRNLPIGYTFFADDLDISEYASGAIRTLGDMGIVSGNIEKQFLPLNSITRAEVATIICRALDYIESH